MASNSRSDPDLDFHQQAERRAKEAAEAIRSALSDVWRRDLDALRTELGARLAALQPTVSDSDVATPIVRLAKELCGAVAKEAEEAAQSQLDQARADQAELLQKIEAAHAEAHAIRAVLTAAQEEAIGSQARLAIEARERTVLAASLETAHRAITTARAETDASQADNACLRRTIEALQGQVREAEAALTEAGAVRAELTATVEEARMRHATLAAQLSAALQDVATARHELQERASRFEAAERRLQALETEHARVRQALADSEAQLVATARDLAELAEANTRLEALQQQLADRQDAVPLARLRGSLQALDGLSSARDVLATFLKELERSFDRVALFVVRENRLEGWRSVGIEPTTDVSNLIIPLSVDSPLTRAASERRAIILEGNTDEPRPGLLGHDIYAAVAIPIVTEQGHVAVVYAEVARRLHPESCLIELQMAEILGEHVTRSLTHVERPSAAAASNAEAPRYDEKATAASRPAPTPSPTYPGPSRAAERVRMSETVEVVVDGATAQLIDISNLGAQVTCAKTIRPNHQVRMVLPQAGQSTLCCGHVVWALFEMAPGGGRYRAGLKFTSVDTDAVALFLSHQLANRHRTPA